MGPCKRSARCVLFVCAVVDSNGGRVAPLTSSRGGWGPPAKFGQDLIKAPPPRRTGLVNVSVSVKQPYAQRPPALHNSLLTSRRR